MLKKKLAAGLVAITASAAFATGANADSHMGSGMPDVKILVSNCFNCHGTDGASVGVIDELDTLPARRIAKKMREFKAGEKAATIMTRIAKGYSDAEIDAMANYIQQVNRR